MQEKILLSESAYKIEGQPMFKVLDKVQKLEQQGIDIVHFEIGDPDFDTPPSYNRGRLLFYEKRRDALRQFYGAI